MYAKASGLTDLQLLRLSAVVKVVMCGGGGGSASEVDTHKNIDSVLHTKNYISSAQHIFR